MLENNGNQQKINVQQLLLNSIKSRNCAIFIGAGLSKIPGYPDLKDLLKLLAVKADLQELAEKDLSDDWMDDFQQIQEHIGYDNFSKALLDIFNPETKTTDYDPILIDILNIPFCAYVTTNYDPCLEFANRRLPTPRNSFSYPTLPIKNLLGNHIFHIHGYIDPKDPSSVNTIVLTREKYDEAYDDRQSTSAFLKVLFDELDVLFVGFSWTDLPLISLINKTKEIREYRESVASEKNMFLPKETLKFTIISEETYQRDIRKNHFIRKLRVLPIVYPTVRSTHLKLNRIIENIRDQTAEEKLTPMPTLPN